MMMREREGRGRQKEITVSCGRSDHSDTRVSLLHLWPPIKWYYPVCYSDIYIVVINRA